jgi:hypothetical protein
MKTAVFQVSESDGTAHLVCVRMPNLQSACWLEERLREQAGPQKEIRLLGRFDGVHAALGQHEAEALILGGFCPLHTAALTLEEVVDWVLLRAQRP